MEKKKTRIVTHNSKFHADDVFAVATLLLYLGDGADVEIIRTRDPEIIETGDYVVDVGLEYDPARNRFDHHQKGGAGDRSNGIPHASFGLVWKKYGEVLCGNIETAYRIDNFLVQSIDAGDNGVDLSTPLIEGAFPYQISDAIAVQNPTHTEGGSATHEDERFLEVVSWTLPLLRYEIFRRKYECEALRGVEIAYERAENKQLIVFNEDELWNRMIVVEGLQRYSEPLFAVRPYHNGKKSDRWQVVPVITKPYHMELRKKLPKAWGGLSGEDFARVSGVPDADFCHRVLFMCTAKSKEGALALAKLALEA